MKKIIIILALCFFCLPLFAYAENLGNATDKTCYNANDEITYMQEGYAYWFNAPLYGNDYIAGVPFVIVGQKVGAMYVASHLYFATHNKLIIVNSDTPSCAGNDYDGCIILLEGATLAYYTNDVEFDYNNTCTGTALGTMDTIMGSVVNTVIGLIIKVFSTYWPFILVFSIIAGLIGIFIKFTKLGIR